MHTGAKRARKIDKVINRGTGGLPVDRGRYDNGNIAATIESIRIHNERPGNGAPWRPDDLRKPSTLWRTVTGRLRVVWLSGWRLVDYAHVAGKGMKRGSCGIQVLSFRGPE